MEGIWAAVGRLPAAPGLEPSLRVKATPGDPVGEVCSHVHPRTCLHPFRATKVCSALDKKEGQGGVGAQVTGGLGFGLCQF